MKFQFLVLLILLNFISGFSQACTLYDVDSNLAGFINENSSFVYDTHNQGVGYITSSGFIYNNNNDSVGFIQKNSNDIYDASGNFVGSSTSNHLYDHQGNYIGYVIGACSEIQAGALKLLILK